MPTIATTGVSCCAPTRRGSVRLHCRFSTFFLPFLCVLVSSLCLLLFSGDDARTPGCPDFLAASFTGEGVNTCN